ncbi:MAG: hypothetical protein AAF985_11670, partial [Bacteroidota bacterium]
IAINHNGVSDTQESLQRFSLVQGGARLVIKKVEASLDDFQTIITDPSTIHNLIPEDIRLELQMEIERYDFLDPNTQLTVENNYNSGQHLNILKWNFLLGAEDYELEWVYVDNKVAGTAPSGEAVFANAVNVMVSSNHYTIATIYPTGKLYWRVRPVGRFIRGVNGNFDHYKYGKWSDIGELNLANEFGDQIAGEGASYKNWQWTTTFAEEGKYKRVMSYFDDGLRNRQTQTNLSTEEQTLVATAHYDVEGRPTLNVLPVPALGNNNLFYKENFNKPAVTGSGLSYNRAHFDRDFTNSCLSSLPDPLSQIKEDGGAGFYFSSGLYSDASADVLYKEMIPDAEGYPMTQVRYLNDGTGRIAWQSGVGEFYQLGKGHETRYFYDDPSSTQLHRLFGSNVGKAIYYKRNLVMDANGQMSVSYIDAAGRVIATALTGVVPDNVEALSSAGAKEVEFTESLMDNNKVEGLVSFAQSSIMNELVGNSFKLRYDMSGLNQSLNISDCGTICATCDYELLIRIEDPCGTVVYNQVYSIVGEDNCTGQGNYSPSNLPIQDSLVLHQIGLYQVTKELRVAPWSLDEWVDYLTNISNCLPELEDISLPLIDTLDCAITCEQLCRLSLGEDATPMQIATCIAMNPECNPYKLGSELLGTSPSCNEIISQLHHQISPGGCLYEFEVAGKAWWDGKVEDDEEFILADGTIATLASNSNLEDILTDPAQWQDSWLEVLTPYHPEYCYYLLCTNSSPSREFDMDLEFDSIYQIPPPLLDWDYVEDLVDLDPMFFDNNNDGDGFYYKYTDLSLDNATETAIANALSDVGVNSGTSLKDIFLDRLRDYGECGGVMLNIVEYLACAIDNSQQDPLNQWSLFRSVYLGAKQKLRSMILVGAGLGNNKNGWCNRLTDTDPLYGANCPSVIPSQAINEINSPTNNGSGGSGSTQTQVNDFVQNYQAYADCSDLCTYRVEEWMAAILTACPSAVTESHPDFTALKNALAVFCEEHCDQENVMAYLLTEFVQAFFVPNSSNNNLYYNAVTNFQAHCPDIIPIIEDIAVPQDELYSPVLDENGDSICSVGSNDCFVSLLNRVSTLFPLDNNCSPAVYTATGDEQHCYSTITIAPGTSSHIDIIGSSLCCSQFSLSTADFCDIISISNPRLVDNGTDVFLKVDVLEDVGNDSILTTVDMFCAPPPPAPPGGPPSSPTSYPECLVECLMGPNDGLIINTDNLLTDCIEELVAEAEIVQFQTWQDSINTMVEELLSQRNCLEGITETFSVTYKTREHHYTLYYYDQAGNLVQTVPPKGVKPVAAANFDVNGVWDGTEPQHKLVTQYQYNSLGQVLWQESPDGGATNFKYDYAQRLRFSENAEQAADDRYSFTRYDGEGRIIRVGEVSLEEVPVLKKFADLNDAELNDLSIPADGEPELEEVTYTYYNVPSSPDNSFPQTHLRGRVAMSKNDHIETRYSYDAHGNVQALQHEVNGLGGLKQRVFYDYDLISGNVLTVAYQPDQEDKFYHRYAYDADNRLTSVYTSQDGVLYDLDARYFYYLHGPLARIELGQDKVQGLDYYYTLQGWIKGVNMAGENAHGFEPGRDGGSGLNQWMGRDEMAYALGYHEEDYTPIGGVNVNLGVTSNSIWTDFNSSGTSGLFNGNIAWMVTDLPHFDDLGEEGIRGMAYQYDQLHRIKAATSFGSVPGSSFTWSQDDLYNSSYSYDANGNLMSLKRYMPNESGSSTLIDDLVYSYKSNTNQLTDVKELVPTVPNDPSFKSHFVANHNYKYDKIGNLTADKTEEVETIEWTVYGKVAKITYAPDNAWGIDFTTYTYDVAGNRLSKKIDYSSNTTNIIYYLRDASGNVLSIYEKETSGITQKEVPLYGSSRLGLQKFIGRSIDFPNSNDPISLSSQELFERQRGNKVYELSNHLGNVLATVSDLKVGMDESGDGFVDYYGGLVLSASDYYPFGLTQYSRNYNSPDYRYGFNGMEKNQDNEFGSQVTHTTEYRQYSSAIGRFLS